MSSGPAEKPAASAVARRRYRLGEMMVKFSVISPDQLAQALARQETIGGRLGRNLIHLGFVGEDVFIRFLSSQLKLPAVNLNRVRIPPEIQKLVPWELVQRYGVVPVKRVEKSLYLGMTDPTDLNTARELEFSLDMKVVPLVLAESQWEFVVQFGNAHGWGREPLVKKPAEESAGVVNYDLTMLMMELIARKGSDIHLSAGVQPTFRVNDLMVRLDMPPLTPQAVEELIRPLLSPRQREYLASHSEMDFAIQQDGIGRFRVNVYRQRNSLAVAMRHVSERIPGLQELNLPAWLEEYAGRKQGLILITGPSGHGKSTTMACLIDLINSSRRTNVITIEDPIEYQHRHRLSNVNQREVGTDTETFHDGLRYLLRQNPDVIAIGEMRDLESIYTALTAAETGHLVMATLHTNSAVSTIDRIIDVFPGAQQNQIRHQLAQSLLLVFSQRLIPRADGAGRILAYERLSNSYRIQNAIREGRTHLLRSQLAATTEDYGALEASLGELVRRGLVRYEEGLKYVENQKLYENCARPGR